MILLLCGLLAKADDTVTIRLHVPTDAPAVAATVSTRWLGEDRTLPLVPTDRDGELAATLSGAPVRMLPVFLDLTVDPTQPALRAYRGLEVLPSGDVELVYSLDSAVPPRVHRIAATTANGRDALARREGGLVGGSLAWGAAMVALVGLLLRRRPAPEPQDPGPWRWWWSVPIWALLAMLWTWPAINAGGGVMVGRHFDLPGVLWALDASERLLSGGLQDTLTAWPLGGDYRRLDSFTLLPIGALLADLGVDRLHGALQIVGVFLLGISGEAFARAVGARGWWGLLGGAALALSGLSANVLLEGHVFHLLNPWLPLLGLAWWKATGANSRRIWGVISGLCFGLCLLTTAYIGVTAAVVVACFAVPAIRKRSTWPAMGAAAATVLVLAVPYALVFVSGTDIAPGSSGHIVSAHLVSLAGPTPEIDRGRHSQAIALPGLMLALAMLTPMLLGRRRGVLIGAAAITAMMAMGSGLAISEGPAVLPLPMALVEALGGGAFLRFPMRLFWGTLLCMGALAAWGGTALEARLGRGARLLVLLALIEPFVHIRAPLRQQTRLSTSPSVYSQVDGPVLDLFPEGTTEPHELEQWFTRFTCANQRHHHNPIAEHCTATTTEANPRHRLNRWLIARLLEGSLSEARQQLGDMGFVGVALHPDLFEAGDRSRIQDALAAVDPSPLRSTDGGALVALYRLPAQAAADPAGVYHALSDAPPAALGAKERRTAHDFISLQIEVETEEIERDGVYLAVLRPPGQDEQVLSLFNDGRYPTDLPEDIAWVAHTMDPLPAEFSLILIRRTPEAQSTLWSGPVQLHAARERLVFRMTSETSAVPIAAAPAFTSPPVGRHNDTIALLGWSGIAVLSGGFWLMRWRRRRKN